MPCMDSCTAMAIYDKVSFGKILEVCLLEYLTYGLHMTACMRVVPLCYLSGTDFCLGILFNATHETDLETPRVSD